MELTLLNYEDKKTVISYDMQNNEYWKIFYNTERKGFYDILENDILSNSLKSNNLDVCRDKYI